MQSNKTALLRFIRKLYVDVGEMRWHVLAIATAVHATVSWKLLVLAKEDTLTEFSTFVYFYMTTSTTVGYGDLSPQTEAGRWVTIFFIMVGGIALFTSVIAKSIANISSYWRRNMDGLGNYSRLIGATVIVGYEPNRTRRMIDEVHAGSDQPEKIVLMAGQNIPDPDNRVHYVQATSLASEPDLRRAGVENAARVIVYADNDEQTLAAALAVAALNPAAHLVAYFVNAQSAQLLKKHTRAECVVSTSVELVVRAMQDPGASLVMSALSSTTENATVYSLRLPDGLKVSYLQADRYLQTTKRANLIAAKPPSEDHPTFNPGEDFVLSSGSQIYFIRDERLKESEVDWQAMASTA